MSHRPFIQLWPSLQEFADDLRILRSTAKGHLQRGKIPDVDWERTIEGAQRRGFGHIVTYEALAAACARPPHPRWTPRVRQSASRETEAA